ncbi:MAG: chromate transporter [Verrucomicrobia bacterium]|nr:chromate transporter [Verrucomicrobiota bacterium]
MKAAPHPPAPRLRELFGTWFVFGIQSFGGGSPTFYLIHRACTERGWLTEAEFIRTWALAQVSPGINLVKLTALVGYKLRGWPGLVATMTGMLLPSATVTVLMTAGFSMIRDRPMVQAAMRGILPATIGLSLAAGARMGRPILNQARQEGRPRLGAHFAVTAFAAALMGTGHFSPVLILLTAGFATLLLLMVLPVREKPSAEKPVA